VPPKLLVFLLLTFSAKSQEFVPLDQALESKIDVWGETAMKQPNGASYDAFEHLLPPPRYVNADFRFYPILLSAPNAKVKARLISNGSGVNLKGGARSWNDVGTPVLFRVGPDEFTFGGELKRLQHPTFAEGYLPIAEIRYEHPTPMQAEGKVPFTGAIKDRVPEIYTLEAFASTDSDLDSNGVVLVKFSLAAGSNGIITAQIDSRTNHFADGKVLNENGQVLAWFDENWTWERQRVHARLTLSKAATMAIATKPIAAEVTKRKAVSATYYEQQRLQCVDTWQKFLAEGMNVVTPEPLVNNAWRNLLIQDFSIINGDRMNYSAGNQYEKMYAAESSDAALPIMWWGHEKDMPRLLSIILDINDKRLPHHFASHKINDICRYYWQSRDLDFVKATRPRWQTNLDLILNDRTIEHGLLSKDNYCTDIEVPVYNLSANAKCWAALRDIVPVLEELGDEAQAKHVGEIAAQFKKDILAAVEKNTRHETQPPFIPMALFYEEQIHDPITDTRVGSYWDLVVNYVIGSRIFAGSERELWLPHYLEQHGGLCMGMTRSAAANNSFWTGKYRTNPLYGMRYILDALRRDDPERALVSFYGMFAHGMTRNTFIGAEGCSLEPLDEGGRFFYCPPNSTSNGQWLAALRYMLVQDWDTDEDGRPDTLRLLLGTPRHWLEDGKSITVERAPTAFGPVSIKVESHLSKGEVLANVQLPERNPPQKTQLRVRLPEGWKVTSVKVGSKEIAADDKGTIDISSLRGKQSFRFQVAKN